MRIIHVVTLLSPDGRFGGPTKVALDLASQQLSDGHDVTLLAGAQGYDVPPSEVRGVPVRLFPTRQLVPGVGFAGLVAPGLGRALRRMLGEADVVHLHLARDLITQTAARVVRHSSVPYVVQTHGMIDHSDRLLAHLLDLLSTRAVLREAGGVLYLTEGEREELSRLGASPGAMALLGNAIALDSGPLGTDRSEIVFLARLHPRKGAALFARAAAQLARRDANLRFAIAGPDEGDLLAVLSELGSDDSRESVRIIGPVAPDRVANVFAAAVLYVLPAEAEPFGLTILEAMAQETPVLLHETAVLSPVVVRAGAGATFSGSAGDLADAIAELVSDPERLRLMGKAGRALVAKAFSLDKLAGLVQEAYRRALP